MYDKIKLEGELVRLRKISIHDADSIFENAKDKDISDLLPKPINTITDAKGYVKTIQKMWREEIGLIFGIEDKSKIIGIIGLSNLDPDSMNAQVGYWVAKSYWRKGIAKESLMLIMEFAFLELKLVKLYAKIYSNNIPSIRLIKKFRFKLEGRLRKQGKYKGHWDDQLIYGILKEEYRV